MNAESTSLLKHDQHCPNHDDDDSFRARKTMTKTLATRAIVVVVCVAAIVGAIYMSTGSPSIDSHAAPSGAVGLLREGSTTTTETGMHPIVGGNGCNIDKFKVHIQNNLEVPLYAMYGTPSEGNLQPNGCNGSSNHVDDYNSCWKVLPGTTNSISATTNSACKGVEGTFTYGPSAAYTTQTGLKSIALSYKDEGGKHGSLKHDQQFNYDSHKGYTFGQQYATDMSKCQDQNHLKCVITMTVEITASPPTPASVIAYDGSWQLILTHANVVQTAGTSWSNSESSTIGTSFTHGFTEGVSSKFGTTSVSASASQTWSASSSNTISHTNSGSKVISCGSIPCAGKLYQWQTAAKYTDGSTQIVRSCFFHCVPDSSHNGPECPLNYCETDGCHCCNAVWMLDNNSATANRLPPYAGGTCKAECKPSGVACNLNDVNNGIIPCCSGTCNSRGILTGGTCD